jgi:hypothetical protein
MNCAGIRHPGLPTMSVAAGMSTTGAVKVWSSQRRPPRRWEALARFPGTQGRSEHLCRARHREAEALPDRNPGLRPGSAMRDPVS